MEDIMDPVILAIYFLPIAAICIIAIIFYRRKQHKDDTLQRNCSKGSQKEQSQQLQCKNGKQDEKSSHQSSNTKGNKGKINANSGGSAAGGVNKRHDKTTYSHPWLASTLKGHTDDIRDIDFSSNGKYLASCAEENNSTSTPTSASHKTINNILRHRRTSDLADAANDDINSSSSNEDLTATYQTKSKKTTKSRHWRRKQQRKQQAQLSQNADEADTSSSSSSVTSEKAVSQPINIKSGNSAKKTNTSTSPNVPTAASLSTKRGSNASLSSTCSSTSSSPSNASRIDKFVKIQRALAPPLRQHTKLNLHERDLFKYLKYYVIDTHLLRMYGYPVESVIHMGSFEIFKCTLKPIGAQQNQIINKNDGLVANVAQLSGDSGQGSGTSSPPSVDSDSSEVGEEDTTTTTFCTPDGNYQIFAQYNNKSMEKQCVRCQSSFLVTENGEYLTGDECCYHWGKLLQIYAGGKGLISQYSCCNGDSTSDGCSRNPFHVWTGIVCGMNGPYDDFVRTQPRINSTAVDKKVYALDCEMVFTALGLEVAKVSVVSSEGQVVYEHFVRPKGHIADYNTRFSGITENDLKSSKMNQNHVKSLAEVQKDLLEFINSDTILIGHALENDLRVLKIVHKNIIDTSISFPHANGFPYRRALKSLTKSFLKRDIQTSESGHSSFEDSRACLELMLWKVRKEFLTY